MTSALRKRQIRQDKRPALVVVGDIVWTLTQDTKVREPVYVNKREQAQAVDGQIYCYWMVCSCGRLRYAKPNSLHQIMLCRICQHDERLRRRREKDA